MKWIIILLFLCCIAEAKTVPLEEVKAFLADEKKRISEYGDTPFQTTQDLAFLCYVAEDWRQALTLLENDAPDLRRQSLIIVASGALPPQDGIRFLNGMCDLIEAGKVDIKSWILHGGLGEGRDDFFAYYYDQPEVTAVIERFEAIYKEHEPGKWDGYFSKIKSGEGKKNLVKMLAACGESMPDTYKANSKEEYYRLVKLYEGSLAGRPIVELLREEMNKNHPAPVARETYDVIETLEDGRMIVHTKYRDEDSKEQSPSSGQPQTPPKNRNLLWLGILALAAIGTAAVWRLVKRKW